jgi:hypothetical protein
MSLDCMVCRTALYQTETLTKDFFRLHAALRLHTASAVPVGFKFQSSSRYLRVKVLVADARDHLEARPSMLTQVQIM